MKKQRTTATMELDQLSGLPDHILHTIMFFLSNKDATKIRAVSRGFRSAGIAFPVIDLEYNFFRKSKSKTQLKSLLETAESALNRLRENNISLEKFRLGLLNPLELDPLEEIRKVIDSAIENKVRELDINFCIKDAPTLNDLNKSCFKYQFPLDQHYIKSIRILKLGGIQLPNSTLNFPSLEIMHLSKCLGPTDLTISSTRLKVVKLENFYGSSEIKIQANNLEEFSFKQLPSVQPPQPPLGSVYMSECKFIRTFDLSGISLVSDEWISKNLSELVHLEVLYLRKCSSLRNLVISNSCLKEFVLEECNSLEKVKIVAESLNSFVFKRGTGRIEPSDIEITAAEFLSNLEIYNGSITDEWVERLMENSCLLENVTFSECNLLSKLKICNENLRDLKLLDCNSLKEAEMITRNLCSLSYKNSKSIPPSVFVIDSAKVEAEVKLERPYHVSKNEWYEVLREFLVCFGHCKLLTLACDYSEVLIFPKIMRENTLPPLFDIKHVKIQTGSTFELELVDSLLWCCRQPHSLSVAAFPSSSIEKIIEFAYDKTRDTRGDYNCCWDAPVKCWKHYLKEYKMINFEDKEYQIMKQFLETNIKKREKST